MNTPDASTRQWTERPSASNGLLADNGSMFQQLFERSADAIFLFDPAREVFVDCNQAAVQMMRATSKQQLLLVHPAELSPEFQPDGKSSRDKTPEVINVAIGKGSHRFEWRARRMDGTEFPLEVLLTAVQSGDHPLMATVCRDITGRKRVEQETLELNASLEQRVAERTAALKTSEARFRALVENAPEAIVVFDGDTGRFLFGNEHACRLYGVPMEKLAALTPADVSPEFQPGGRRSSELAREKMDEALAGGRLVFEWTHQRPDGSLVPTEVRLLRLPAEGQNLIRASIIDNSERKRAEQALRESEEKFRALFEGSSQGVVLHDENQILEVNPAAVRIMGCQSPQELLGKHPGDTSPPFQPNGESSAVLARKYIQECMTKGSARFDWVSQTPQGREIPVEVTLTRIQWSGRQVIQALISDISERKKAEAELRASEARLRESEARFSAAFHASQALIGVLRVSDGKYVLANDAHLNWLGYPREEVLGHTCLELGMWENPEERDLLLKDIHAAGSVRQRECRWRNRRGERFTVLLSAETIKLDDTPHILLMALDITQRKRAEEELRASETRLRESEARFSAAFNASPIMTGITRASDARFVLVNDAALNWVGCSREEVLGRTAVELGLWEDPAQRDRFWNEVRSSGSSRQLECRLKNRRGEAATMLASGVTIEINGVDHLLVMMVDISERKRTEAELRASEARLRESEARFAAAFRASPVSMTISRMEDGRTVLANEAFLKWTGYRLDDVLGRNSEELSLWADPAEREPFWEELRRHRFIHERECRVRNRHGQTFTMLLSADRIEINGEPHLLSVGLDITERQQAEAELRASEARLRESEARFSAAFHASPIITAISRASDAKFVLANDAFLKWSGYSRDEVVGRTAMELGIWQNADERKRFWEEVRSAGSVRARESGLRNRFGKVSTMLASGVIIAFNGEDHLLGIMLDISQRKLAEAELQRTLARELELSRLKSNFVSMVSHEFRTPLSIIQSSAELLHDFYQRMPAAEREEQLDSITRHTRRMAEMMEEILVLSCLDAGKLDFQPAALDLKGFCRRLVDEVRSATNRRCAIELSLNSIPQDAEADERLLGHIFTNLLSNAVKYSEPGAVVGFAVERDGADAVCMVRDQGIGIGAEDQENLFKAFHRGGNVGTRPGTGLGLLVVKRCVELHRGNVQLDSRLGEGTTVTVRLPVFGKSL